jgi:hypothetical protein
LNSDGKKIATRENCFKLPTSPSKKYARWWVIREPPIYNGIQKEI